MLLWRIKEDMKDGFEREIRYLRLSITELCNLRCRYCMPEDGVCKKAHEQMLTEDEMIMAVEAAASLGIRKLRITGGEPLVKKNVLSICERAANVPGIKEVCITTNGILLPKMAKDLRKAGVSRVNISLDTLDPEKFAYVTRIGKLEDAMNGIQAALDADFEKIKINAVLIGGFNDDEIPAFGELTKKYPIDVRFIELMPMYDSGDFKEASYMKCQEVLNHLPPMEKIPTDGGVADLYRLPGAKGNIGLISPVSNHFCRGCNRIRLTADGNFKPCLHSPAEYNVKGLNKEEMVEMIKKAILAKPGQHEELSYEHRSEANRNMNQIGG